MESGFQVRTLPSRIARNRWGLYFFDAENKDNCYWFAKDYKAVDAGAAEQFSSSREAKKFRHKVLNQAPKMSHVNKIARATGTRRVNKNSVSKLTVDTTV